jgi:hypothetical protein
MAIAKPDVIAYCKTGAEHPDNQRFATDVERWLGLSITRLRSTDYADTWDVWGRRKYISGTAGAPCTLELKVKPRLAFERPIETPLIERGITKAATIAMIKRAGIEPPITYAMGFHNANCLPCGKATSPAYWALIRAKFPAEFNRMAALSRRLGARLTRIDGERVFIDEIPSDYPTTDPIAPECDFLCSLAEQEMPEGSIEEARRAPA